jgi:hypothetical protein
MTAELWPGCTDTPVVADSVEPNEEMVSLIGQRSLDLPTSPPGKLTTREKLGGEPWPRLGNPDRPEQRGTSIRLADGVLPELAHSFGLADAEVFRLTSPPGQEAFR